MRITLLRHGSAGHADAARWPDDDLRPLTPHGEKRTLAAAHGLARLCDPDARVFTSPLRRAEQTAKLLHDLLGGTAPVAAEWLRPGTSYRRAVDELHRLDSSASVVLVGHEPDLGRLAGVLLFGAPKTLPLKKSGACTIEFVGVLQPGHGLLRWFAPPRMLRRLSQRGSKA